MTLTQVETPPQSPDHITTGRLYSLYQEARRAREPRVNQWRRNYLLANNRWGKSPDDPRDSEIYPILRSRVAWMTDQEISFSIDPAAEPNDAFHDYQMKLGEQLEALLNTNYRTGRWYEQITLMLWDAPIYGAGLLKCVWDSGLDGGLGNVGIQRVDPWGFYPDPNATSFKDAQYFFEVHNWSLDEIIRRFPNVDARRLEDAAMHGDTVDENSRPQSKNFPKTNSYDALDAIPTNLGQGPVAFGPPGQGTMRKGVLTQGINVYECWVRQNVHETRESTDPLQGKDEKVVYDEWRVICFTNDIVLLDETAENLWEMNRHPYVRYVDDEMGEFWSTPLVTHLAPCQLALNTLLAQLQNNAALIGNPIFMDVAGAGLERSAVINKPGQRLTLKNANAFPTGIKPEWLTPPNMPTSTYQLVEFWIARMENIAGISEVGKGKVPSGRQAQQTTQAVQESGFAPIRSSMRNLEQTLSVAGELISQLVIVNYDEPRVVAILGPDGDDTALRLAANHFYTPTAQGKQPLRYVMQVSAGASNPTSRQARIAEADALYAMGAADMQFLLQAHRIPNWQAVLQRTQKELELKAQAAEKGHKGTHPK